MDRSFWHKQGKEPLFPDLLWSRPENRTQAGKLLIIGGNAHGFAAAAEAYAVSVASGIGTAHVLLPDVIKKVVGPVLETADFAPSTPSGSFSQKALSDLLAHAQWSDAVLMAGDLGRNSETAVMLESFSRKYSGQLTITKDAIDYFTSTPMTILSRPETTFALSLAQLQKLGQQSKTTQAITFGMDMLHLVDWLHAFTEKYAISIVTKHLDTIFVANMGKVSTTPTVVSLEDAWRLPTATAGVVWVIQNPTKPFEALTTSVSSNVRS